MEGKKVLWVVFSIALALVVVLAGGLFLLRPRQPRSAAAPAGAAPSLQGYDPYEYVRGTSEPPGLTLPPAESQPVVIVVGEPPATQVPQQPPLPPEQAFEPQPLPAKTIAPQAAARPPSVVQAAPAVKPAAKPAAQAAAKPAPKAAPKAVRVTEYWIQAGSFSSAARAEEVARRLEERGLAARTSTRDLNGKTHFRVRVGPYASKAEAEKFLGWIRELKGFEASYISMVAGQHAMP
jgi:DedD protein